MILLSTIHSTFKPSVCYGRKGDEVTVISHHHNVLIVEDAKGQRFPAGVEHVEGFAGPEQIETQTKIINRQPARKQKQAATNINPQLF